MIVDKIEEYLKSKDFTVKDGLRYEIEKMAGYTFKSQFMEERDSTGEGKIYISSAGKCARQLAYQFHGIPKNGKEMDARAKIVFWTGDLSEFTVVGLAKLSGVSLTATGMNQVYVKKRLALRGAGDVVREGILSGMADGLVLNDEQKGMGLLEVKSMSTYAFERFERGDIDEAYLAQVNVYMELLGLTWCVMVALCKENGVLFERILTKDEKVLNAVRANVKKVILSTPDDLPSAPPEYGPNDKGYYTWNCTYCSYWKTCRPGARQVLVKDKYKLQEVEYGPNKQANRPANSRAPKRNLQGKQASAPSGGGARSVKSDVGKGKSAADIESKGGKAEVDNAGANKPRRKRNVRAKAGGRKSGGKRSKVETPSVPSKRQTVGAPVSNQTTSGGNSSEHLKKEDKK